jgi:hypothetical protein
MENHFIKITDTYAESSRQKAEGRRQKAESYRWGRLELALASEANA